MDSSYYAFICALCEKDPTKIENLNNIIQ